MNLPVLEKKKAENVACQDGFVMYQVSSHNELQCSRPQACIY
jgi:hypothetical protein